MRGMNQTREETYILQLEIKMEKVKLNNKWNYIKPDGTYISDIWFDAVDYFKDGMCYFKDGFGNVKLNNDSYKLDKRGNLYFTFRN